MHCTHLSGGFVTTLFDFWPSLHQLNAYAWTLIALSSIVHAIYFWSLANAYRHIGINYVFPFARGLGALIAVLIGVIVLGDRPSTITLVGIGLILVANFIEPLVSWFSKESLVGKRAFFFTFLTASMMGIYHLIDKLAVDQMATPIYLSGLITGTWCLLAIPVVRSGRFQKEWKLGFFRIFVASVFLTLGFLFILMALDISSLSYVVALRSMSTIFAVLIGIVYFKEQVSRYRWSSVLLIAFGLFLVGIS